MKVTWLHQFLSLMLIRLFETEFNEEVTETLTKDGQILTKTHVKKLTSHGNALACFVSIDVFQVKYMDA